ncbi:MAG: DNA glycosylase [Rhodospirillaceae bacterium]|nr:DNA glycosylase [Rhodospirillaceae bacterium]|tara:strand:- start:1149 stop:1967 length:819 start_codon:yes stop_codon:yes gene_type:complete
MPTKKQRSLETKLPEGHTIHRAARDHRRILAGSTLEVVSPQGRFSEGANIISGQFCLTVEAFGKHLLYKFENNLTLHIHLGLFGRISKNKQPLREPRGAVRVRLISQTHFVDINGPTICRVLNDNETKALINRIGPDVLRPDANPDLAFERITKSKAPIGRLIMDQSVIAGIGNIYRSEILWRQSVHPEIPGKEIDRGTFDRIWDDAKTLLKIGVKKNAIVTVDAVQPSKTRYGERVNIFAKEKCPRCEGSIRRLEINGRNAFVCEICQIPP